MTRGARISVLVILIGAAIAANLIGPGLFWEAHPETFLALLVFVAVGGLVGEVCLLAIWCALAAQAVKYRLPLTFSLVSVVACAYVMGLQLAADGLPPDVALLICGAAVGLFCCLQVPLWVFRAALRRRIDLKDAEPVDAKMESAQFGLRYLMGCTAGVAVLIVVVQHSIPDEDWDGNIPWLEVILLGLIFMVFSALICIPCIWAALSDHGRGIGCGVLFLVGVIGTGFVTIAITFVVGGGPDLDEIIRDVFGFGAGAAMTMLFVLLIVRSLGYRLVRTTRSNEALPASSPAREESL
jgi:hypothetical protein